MIIGHPWEYVFDVYDAHGKLKKRISRDYDLVPFSPDELAFWRRLRDTYRDSPNPFSDFLVDERGWLFVKTSQWTPDRSRLYFDIFDGEGKYVNRIPFPARDPIRANDFWAPRDPFLVQGGKIYLVEEEQDGNLSVGRYSLVKKQR